VKGAHRGFDIEVTREKSLGGTPHTYFSVFRKSDGREMESGYTEAEDSVYAVFGWMKNRVDEWLALPTPRKAEDF
jgi:hypothetical protein